MLHMKFITTNIFKIKSNVIRELINVLISAVVSTAMILLVRFTNIPNPNLILMTALVVITVLLGFIPGIVPTLSMIIYSFWFFSTKNDFVTFTSMNATKVVVAIITGLLCYAFTGTINLLYERDANKILKENEELNRDNDKLKQISKTDALTNTKNRFSLRNDLVGYIDKDIQVMIFDIDNFKTINDTYGHTAGDVVLSSVSEFTKMCFEDESVYRYGGDEFVVVKTHLSLSEFKRMLKEFQSSITAIKYEGHSIDIKLSIGYTYGVPESAEDLKEMIRYADELMYKVKSDSKNGALGKKFEL